MNILLTNDDGIYAAGIKTLATILYENGHNLAIVSPDRERSATGHAITLNQPLRADKINDDFFPDVDCYKITGTPVDCIKLGITSLIDFKPDLVISGINDGANVGFDVIYSGTVSAAIEARMMGFSSIAVSCAIKNKNKDYITTANYLNRIIEIINKELDKKILLNINVPGVNPGDIEGVEITKLCDCLYDDYYVKKNDPRGNNYYWLTGNIKGVIDENTDIWALNKNIISITPLKVDFNNHQVKKLLNRKLNFNKIFSNNI